MRRQPPSPDHAAAVSRRLAALGAELDQVRGETREPATPGPEPAAARPPVVVPVPGRHASRRPGSPGAERDLLARLPIGRPHLAVLGAVVAVALAAAAWVALGQRAEPEALEEVTPAASAEASVGASTEPSSPVAPSTGAPAATPAGTDPAAGDAAAGSDATGSEVTVDVAGKVRRPGIAVLPAGSRVVDAIEAAGGTRPAVDLSSLNLARVLVDGEQVLVGAPPPAPAAAAASGGPTSPGALVNINTADATALDTLPGVGPVTAEAILDWRSEHGGFTAVDELLEVDGIGEITLAEIAPHVTV